LKYNEKSTAELYNVVRATSDFIGAKSQGYTPNSTIS